MPLPHLYNIVTIAKLLTINKRLETLIKAARYIHINANINNKLLTINKRLETLIKITQNLSQVIISQKAIVKKKAAYG